jgi:hypothetical protein
LINTYPEWPVKGYCFAPPCVVSKNISLRYTDKIISVIYNNDVVPRMSLGSLEALKNATVQLMEQSDNNIQRMFHVVNAGNNFGDEATKKIAGWLKVKQNVDFSKV